jgi:hypothetical protein
MFLDKDIDITYRTSPLEPPWKALKDKKVGILKWFEKALPILESLSENRIETMVNNLLWYTGEYDKTLEYRVVIPGRGDASVARRMLPRIFNHLHDITEQRVSKMSRYKPGFDVVPTNAEENDRVVTRLIKVAQEAVARRVHMEFLMQDAERWNAVFGEIYIGIEWNPDIGDKKSRKSIERVGDVDIYVKAPWTVFPEPKRKWEDVKWCIDIESIMQIDECRERFDKPKLEADGKKNIFSFNSDVEEKREDEVIVHRIIVPPCKYMPNGYVCYIGNGVILKEEAKEYPYSHGQFPWERHTDIDVPGRLFPQSFYQHIKPIQHVYNKLTAIITRNILLTAHPHIVMPKGSAKREAFANGPTFIEYSGPTEPRVITWSSVPQEVFQFRQEVKAEIGQVSGIQGVSRGAPPPGSRSNSMLRFYEEQEEQRASTQIIKHNELIRRIHLKSASIIADYYPTTSKERMIRVVGKENQYLIEKFAGVKISSEYDVIIQNSTGFSDSMAARLEEVQLIKQIAPTLLSDEQIADVLETKNPQKAYDIATSALKSAERENEMFLDGKDVPEPKPYEDLIVHWKQHVIFLNSPQISTVPEDAMQALEDHVLATEMLMEEKAGINAAFAQQLATLKQFPCFWVPTPQPAKQSAPQPQQDPAAMGGINPMFPMEPQPAMEQAPPAGGMPMDEAPMSDVPPAISAEELMTQ